SGAAQHVEVCGERGAGQIEVVANVTDAKAIRSGLHQQAKDYQSAGLRQCGQGVEGVISFHCSRIIEISWRLVNGRLGRPLLLRSRPVPRPPPPMSASQARLTVLVPVFNESDGLRLLQSRLLPVLDALEHLETAILYVDDGSRDDSWAVIES